MVLRMRFALPFAATLLTAMGCSHGDGSGKEGSGAARFSGTGFDDITELRVDPAAAVDAYGLTRPWTVFSVSVTTAPPGVVPTNAVPSAGGVNVSIDSVVGGRRDYSRSKSGAIDYASSFRLPSDFLFSVPSDLQSSAWTDSLADSDGKLMSQYWNGYLDSDSTEAIEGPFVSYGWEQVWRAGDVYVAYARVDTRTYRVDTQSLVNMENQLAFAAAPGTRGYYRAGYLKLAVRRGTGPDDGNIGYVTPIGLTGIQTLEQGDPVDPASPPENSNVWSLCYQLDQSSPGDKLDAVTQAYHFRIPDGQQGRIADTCGADITPEGAVRTR